MNSVFHVALGAGGLEAFHKPFSGIVVATAWNFGHDPDDVPLHECAAWRLARSIGGPVEELVAPCVLRTINNEPGSLSARRWGLAQLFDPFTAAPDQCRAAAFFDSLIAQQDRHLGNYRWESAEQSLGLIDHGFAFALPGHFHNASVFVEHRWATGDEALNAWERASLAQLEASPSLHGLEGLLDDARAQRVRQRAQEMLSSDAILAAGAW